MHRNLIAFAAVVAIWGAAAPDAPGANAALSLSPLEAWSNVFGGRPAEFGFGVSAPESFRGRAGWSVAVGGRTVARGETAVVAHPWKPGIVKVRFDVPEVKPGVIMPAVLCVVLYGPNEAAARASLEKQLWIFPHDPFADRSRWLKQLQIHLFDPVGKTRPVFEKMNVPFSETRNVDSLGGLKGGVLVIGEGTSLNEYRGLSESMVKAAAGGVPVVCLAPSEGQLGIPGTEGADLPRPGRLTLRRQDVIRELDKRLDATAWPPDGRLVSTSLAVNSDKGRVVGEVVAGDAGWPWLEAHFAENRGRLVVCGFALVQKWDAGPTPRFLLARLLEYITTAGVAAESHAASTFPRTN